MDKIIKIIIDRKGRKFFFTGSDVHTKFGVIRADDIKKAKDGSIIESNRGEKFYIIPPSFTDLYKKIKRLPQIIHIKELGMIAAETGVDKESVVLDSGTGSGAAALFFGHLCRKVYSYDVDAENLRYAKENAEFLDIDNINFKNKDIYGGIDEDDIDLIIFDLPEPWKAIDHAAKALKVGGYLVNYSLQVPQMQEFVNSILKNESFIMLKNIELIERDWKVEGMIARPTSEAVGHTGFLTFARRIK